MKNKIGLMVAMFATGSAFAADGVTVGGYVDAQYNWVKSSGTVPGVNTFLINESAVEINANMGSTKGVLELPFASGAGSSFVNAAHAQAYAWNKFDNGLWWKLGQFHSMYGSEAKRSSDIQFSHYSIITTELMPFTHTGLDLGYALNDNWNLEAMVANHRDLGFQTSGNPDFGVKLGGKVASAYLNEASIAGLFGRDAANKPWMINAVLDFQFGALQVRGDLAAGKYYTSANPLTGAADSVFFGGGATASYDLSDMLTYGLRINAIGNAPVNSANLYAGMPVENLEITTGPQFHMSKNLTTKVDYTFGKQKTSGAGNVNMVNVAAVYKF